MLNDQLELYYWEAMDFTKVYQLKDKQIFLQILREEGLQVKKGANDILNFLDNKGIKKCIAFSSSRHTIQTNLSMAGLTIHCTFLLYKNLDIKK